MRNVQLIQLIQDRIQQNSGAISFSDFMQLALYAPSLGYYQKKPEIFGEKGDFVTAPLISPLFAQCLAQQCKQVLLAIANSDILEIGAGSGQLASDLLAELQHLNALPKHYFIFEISSSLREQQKRLLAQKHPHLLSRIHWLDQLPESFQGVIVANEVMDALPVDLFEMTENGVTERCVTLEQDTFTWCLKPPHTALKIALNTLLEEHPLPQGYQSELCVALHEWIASLAKTLKKGLILLLDYGYGRAEYYHPDRHQGTLMCFYQHQKHDNPLLNVGSQDMTAHVDFTRVAESALDAGLTLSGFTTQAAFLLSCGLLDIAEAKTLSDVEKYQQSQAIKKLTLPSQMGEIIKVMGLTRDFDLPLSGFTLQDRRRNL